MSTHVSTEELARRAAVAAARQQKKRQREEEQADAAPPPSFVPKSVTPFRRMIPVQPPNVSSAPCNSSTSTGQSITVMTYNILAQCLCRRELFPYCKKDHLRVKTRFPILMREITQTLRPDVACLQEVDNFDTIVAPALREAGYEWEYLRKSPEKEAGHGLCIAWKRDKFQKHLYRTIFYDGHHLTHPTPITAETRNVGQILALKFRGEDASASSGPDRGAPGILVSNTHLFWRAAARYEKLRQAWILINEITAVRKDLAQESSLLWPTLMCGDWNSTPDDGVYKTLTKQHLSPSDLASLEPGQYVSSSSKPQPATEPKENEAPAGEPHLLLVNPAPLSRILDSFPTLPRLRSAYATYRPEGGEPLFTNYTNWKGTLDYVFLCEPDNVDIRLEARATKKNYKVSFTKILELPDATHLEPGLPNSDFASDHVCLMAEVCIHPGGD
ncbi:hypothetical protein HDU87_008739 [Geranomyces variabilis]|uniref:Endonuclease/exonuclease/phosphatase domain-containing protein n=1 Tax=Geranomyces variabilis TaxID=109894 RepID=A0AAD5TI09_9FUNG|nr:hypothetical protein HDU87_008739 [Geranomyces variabilis]